MVDKSISFVKTDSIMRLFMRSGELPLDGSCQIVPNHPERD